MKKLLFVLVLMMPFSPSLAGEPLPLDVQRFIDRREGCDHVRSEVPEPNDKQAVHDMARQISALCAGTDKALARLKRKYAANRSVTQRLSDFEPEIEEIKGRR